MRKLVAVAMLGILLVASASIAAAPALYKDVWKSALGKRGTLTSDAGGYVLTLGDGPTIVSFVGEDYVEFRRASNVQGERVPHRAIPMSRLELRGVK